MNQPTEDRIKKLEEEQMRLKEEVRQLREQRTEEIKITRVEVASADVLNQLQAISQKQDEHFNQLNEGLESLSRRQNEYDKGLLSHSRGISTLQSEMQGARADILQIRESQADLRDAIEKTATKDDIAAIRAEHGELLRQILDRLPPKQ